MRDIQILHTHTKTSDGELDYLSALDLCEQNDISVVAFTDHDSIISEENFKLLKGYKGITKWISGIEISSGLPKELGGKATSDLHIVGLFVDPLNEPLKTHCKLANKARVTRMRSMVSNLQKLGFIITEEDCLKASQGEAVARPHVVSALMSVESNVEILNNLKQRMEEESKTNLVVKEKYDAMMKQGERGYPYGILLSENAYIPNVYVDYQYFVDMDKSVKLIRNAGGVALLAHYFTCANKINKDMLDEMLRDGRLDGAETVYGLFGLNRATELKDFIIKTTDIAKKLVIKNNKLESGGADAHKAQDFIDFANSGIYAEKTEGMVQKVLNNSNADKSFSNL
jgi:predicted metal-dependent phosphoesterase TrpH